jgi:hypothetical protein
MAWGVAREAPVGVARAGPGRRRALVAERYALTKPSPRAGTAGSLSGHSIPGGDFTEAPFGLSAEELIDFLVELLFEFVVIEVCVEAHVRHARGQAGGPQAGSVAGSKMWPISAGGRINPYLVAATGRGAWSGRPDRRRARMAEHYARGCGTRRQDYARLAGCQVPTPLTAKPDGAKQKSEMPISTTEARLTNGDWRPATT